MTAVYKPFPDVLSLPAANASVDSSQTKWDRSFAGFSGNVSSQKISQIDFVYAQVEHAHDIFFIQIHKSVLQPRTQRLQSIFGNSIGKLKYEPNLIFYDAVYVRQMLCVSIYVNDFKNIIC